MADDLHTLSAPVRTRCARRPTSASSSRSTSRTCDRCRARARRAAGRRSLLAFAVEGPAPPPALRSAILERPGPSGRTSSRSGRAARSRPSPPRSRSPRRRLRWASACGRRRSTTRCRDSRAAVGVLGDPASRHLPVGGSRGELVVAPSGAGGARGSVCRSCRAGRRTRRGSPIPRCIAPVSSTAAHSRCRGTCATARR